MEINVSTVGITQTKLSMPSKKKKRNYKPFKIKQNGKVWVVLSLVTKFLKKSKQDTEISRTENIIATAVRVGGRGCCLRWSAERLGWSGAPATVPGKGGVLACSTRAGLLQSVKDYQLGTHSEEGSRAWAVNVFKNRVVMYLALRTIMQPRKENAHNILSLKLL